MKIEKCNNDKCGHWHEGWCLYQEETVLAPFSQYTETRHHAFHYDHNEGRLICAECPSDEEKK